MCNPRLTDITRGSSGPLDTRLKRTLIEFVRDNYIKKYKYNQGEVIERIIRKVFLQNKVYLLHKRRTLEF